MLSHSFLPFINNPTRIAINTETIIGNIFYNKLLDDIMSESLSSIISDHLIHALIEPSNFTKKSSQIICSQTCYKNFDKFHVRVNHDPNPHVALEHFLKIIEKLLDKHHAPCKNKSNIQSLN